MSSVVLELQRAALNSTTSIAQGIKNIFLLSTSRMFQDDFEEMSSTVVRWVRMNPLGLYHHCREALTVSAQEDFRCFLEPDPEQVVFVYKW